MLPLLFGVPVVDDIGPPYSLAGLHEAPHSFIAFEPTPSFRPLLRMQDALSYRNPAFSQLRVAQVGPPSLRPTSSVLQFLPRALFPSHGARLVTPRL